MSNEQLIQAHAIPYESHNDLNKLIDDIGDARIVLLGEASHGTEEFYKVRAQITKQLIAEKSFSVIAVEADWPECQQVNDHIKNFDSNKGIDLKNTFKSWPTWMWANEEVVALVDWLKLYNKEIAQTPIGFYGIDLYSLPESLEILLEELPLLNLSSALMKELEEVRNCFQSYNSNADLYAHTIRDSSLNCKEQVAKFVQKIKMNYEHLPHIKEQNLTILMNAVILQNAEAYYRASTERSSLSWNIRDTHMVETIQSLLDYHGKGSKIIVWAHNTHIGDASATTMKSDGSINLGQLLREQNDGKDVYAIGFGTHSGTVIAADDWADPFEVMTVPPAKKKSWEDLLHKSGAFNKYLLFNDKNRSLFNHWIDHRAIGVTYDSNYEQYNYVPSKISERYDAYIHLDQTTALKPL